MAAEFIYTTKPANVVPFLERIRGAGVPSKVTLKTIESFGFKSKNDRRLLPILKGLGLVDSSGAPTERWSQFRSKKTGGAALAQGIEEHYSGLFALYPDAHQKDVEALHSYFSSHTKVSESTLKLIIATFRAVCSIADFESEAPSAPKDGGAASSSTAPDGGSRSENSRRLNASGYGVNINIQLTLPENADSKTFDEFFKSMKKHLLDVK